MDIQVSIFLPSVETVQRTLLFFIVSGQIDQISGAKCTISKIYKFKLKNSEHFYDELQEVSFWRSPLRDDL